jgi:6-phosphogluconate dehydrogenase
MTYLRSNLIAYCSFDMLMLQALYASKLVSYTQGFMLMRQVAQQFGWSLNMGGIALMWRGGCIIRR